MSIKDFSDRLSGRMRGGARAPIMPGRRKEAPSEDNRDPEYEKSPGVAACLEAIRSEAPLILVSGRAGTGKSRLIHYLSSIPEGARQIVVAPTGIAALNVGASTIHSTFKLPFGPIDASALDDGRLGTEIRRIDRLIIDEISMVRADVLDGIDARLRLLRSDPRPFGGVQVMMVGDFLQLPPVVKRDEERILAELGYKTHFAFSAKVVQELPLRVVTLKKVWRQSDQEFIEILGRVREGRDTQAAVSWLNRNCHRPARENTTPMLLTPTRAAAERYNDEGIEAVRRAMRTARGTDARARGEAIGELSFVGQARGTFENAKQLPVPQVQPLLPGVRVMAVRNDMGGRFVNGSLGTIRSVHEATEDEKPYVMVAFDGRRHAVKVGPVEWEDLRHGWNEGSGAIDRNVAGTYEQIPLVLGYATTIHKSQGLTLEDMRLDLGRGAFAPGQLYVALSRAASVGGLSLARAITPRDVQVDEMLSAFLDWTSHHENIDVAVAEG